MRKVFILTALVLALVGKILAEPDSTKRISQGGYDYFTFNINLPSILISCLLMVALYLLWERWKLKSMKYPNENNLNPGSEMANFKNSNENDFELLKSRIKSLEGEVSRLKSTVQDEIFQLREEIKNLGKKVKSASVILEVDYGNQNSGASSQELKSNQQAGEHFDQQATGTYFFLSTPNSGGSFNNSSANPSYKEGASIYKFMNITKNRARFWIDERDASVRLALTYPDKNIDPVCDALNAYDPRARKIDTKQPGEAELQNDKWVVVTKARIRYEN